MATPSEEAGCLNVSKAVEVGVGKEVCVSSYGFRGVSKLSKITKVDDCEDMTLGWAIVVALGIMSPECVPSMLWQGLQEVCGCAISR